MSSEQAIPKLITVGVMAAELSVPLHRVLHVLSTRRHIRPSALAGRVRLYDTAALARVRYELNAIDARCAVGGVRASAGDE